MDHRDIKYHDDSMHSQKQEPSKYFNCILQIRSTVRFVFKSNTQCNQKWKTHLRHKALKSPQEQGAKNACAALHLSPERHKPEQVRCGQSGFRQLCCAIPWHTLFALLPTSITPHLTKTIEERFSTPHNQILDILKYAQKR